MRSFQRRKPLKEAIRGNPSSWASGGSWRFQSGDGLFSQKGSSGSESSIPNRSRKTSRSSATPIPVSESLFPQAFKVRTEGFGPSEDLVKGVLPHSHLFVEASGLHPSDYDVQRRVLELTMPSLAGVTIQPPEASLGQIGASSAKPFSEKREDSLGDAAVPSTVAEQGVPGLVPLTAGLHADVHQQLAQQAWEEHMVLVANTIIDQVEKKTGVQLEAARGSQEELHRSSAEVIIQTVRQEMWRVADALRHVALEQGEDWRHRSQSMVQEISRCIYEQLPRQALQTLVKTSNTTTSEKIHSSTELVVDMLGEKVQNYFHDLEKQLKDVAEEVKKISAPQSSALNPTTVEELPAHSSGESISYPRQASDDLMIVENSSIDAQKMEEVYASIVATIEQSAHQQAENVRNVLSNMFRDQQQAIENSTAAAVSAVASTVAAASVASRMTQEEASEKRKNEHDDDVAPGKKPDYTALEEYIDGALRVAADEIRNSVVGEVRQVVIKFMRERKVEGVEKEKRGCELPDKHWEVLASLEEKVDEVIAHAAGSHQLSENMDQLTAHVIDGQSRIRDVTESVYAALQAQEKCLKELQAGIKEVKEVASIAAAESSLISATLAKDVPSPNDSTHASDHLNSHSNEDSAPVEPAGDKKIMDSLEQRFHQLSTKQEELQKLLGNAIKKIDEKELKSEMQLTEAMKSISDSISSSLAEVTSIAAAVVVPTPAVAVQKEDPLVLERVSIEPEEKTDQKLICTEQIERKKELTSSVQLAQSTIQELEKGIQHIATKLGVYHAKVEKYFSEMKSEVDARVTPAAQLPPPSPLPSTFAGPTAVDIQQIVEEVMNFQVDQLAHQVHAATVLTAKEVADVVSQRNQEVHEQHLLSLASSLGDMVQASMAKFRAEAMTQHNEIKRLLDNQQRVASMDSSLRISDTPKDEVEAEGKPPKEMESSGASSAALVPSGGERDIYHSIDVEERIRSLHENLLAVVREEMDKPLDVELSPIYKYIDGILVLVREELSQHQSAHEQDLSSLKSSLKELHEKLYSLQNYQTPPSDHAELLSAIESKIEDEMTNQAASVRELVEASKVIMDEMKRDHHSSSINGIENSTNSSNNDVLERYLASMTSSSEATATAAADAAASNTAKSVETSLRQVETSLLHDLPEAMRKEQREIVAEVRSTVEALRQETKASLESLQESLATLSVATTQTTEERQSQMTSTSALSEETPSIKKENQEPVSEISSASSSQQQREISAADVAARVVEGVQPLLDEERDALTSAVSLAMQREQNSVQEEVYKLATKTEEQQLAVLGAIRRVEKGDTIVQNAVRDLTRLVEQAEAQKQDPSVISQELLGLRQLVERAQAAQKEDAKVLQQALANGLTSISLSIPSTFPSPSIPAPVILPQKLEETLQQIVTQLRMQQQLLQDAATAAGVASTNANAAQEAVASSISSSSAQVAAFVSTTSKRHTEMNTKLAEQSAALEAMKLSTEEVHEQLAEIMSKLSKVVGSRGGDSEENSSVTVKKMLRDVFERFSDLERQTAKIQEGQDFQENQIYSLADTLRKQVLVPATSPSTDKGRKTIVNEGEEMMNPSGETIGNVSMEVIQDSFKKTEDAVMSSTRDSVREATESLTRLTSKTMADHMVPIRTTLQKIEGHLSLLEMSSGPSSPPPPAAGETVFEEGVEEMKTSIRQVFSELEGLKERITLSSQVQQNALREAMELASKEAAAAATAAVTTATSVPFQGPPSSDSVGGKNLTSEDYAAGLLKLEESMTKRIKELQEGLLKSHYDREEQQVIQWTTAWDEVREDLKYKNKELVGAVKGSISSAMDSISSSQSYLEAAIRTTVKTEKEAIEATLSAKVEQLLASQKQLFTTETSENLKKETAKWMQTLPETVSTKVEEKIAQEFSGFTSKVFDQLQKQHETALSSLSSKAAAQVFVSASAEKKTECPISIPSAEKMKTSPSVAAQSSAVPPHAGGINWALKAIFFFLLQTAVLCGTLILCLYYVFAALLIIFVPCPTPREMYHNDPYTKRQRPKRVADRVI